MPLLRTRFNITLLTIFLSFLSRGSSQQIASATVVFTIVPGWIDMRACARCPLLSDFGISGAGDFIPDRVGCKNNAWLCRASTQGKALADYGDVVLRLCSNYDDQKTATSFLMSYCSQKGYTTIESAVVSTTAAGRTSTPQQSSRPNTLQTSAIPPSSGYTAPPPTSPPSSPSSAASPTGGKASSERNTGLETSEIVGIVIGILRFLVASVTLYYNRKAIKVMLMKPKSR